MKCQLWFNWRGCASSWETFVTRNIFIFIGWCIVFVFLFGYFLFDIFLDDVGVPRGGRY